MKLLRYGDQGREKPGILAPDGSIRDLSAHVDDIAGTVLSEQSLAAIKAIDPLGLPVVPAGARLGPCVGRVGKFVGIGLNYADHATETGIELPKEPVVFLKATSSICGPNDDIRQPRGSTKLDWEVELALVIGRDTAYVSEKDAEQSIAGWCVCHDVSERAFQMERGGLWDKGKGCDTFGPLGPWLVTRDELSNVSELAMWLDVNDRRFQNGSTATMVFKPAFLVSYVSQFMSLQAGDVITTGTPPGVGMAQKPPVFLQAGDRVRLSVEGLGIQSQRVVCMSPSP